jgi:hypothetical protein
VYTVRVDGIRTERKLLKAKEEVGGIKEDLD